MSAPQLYRETQGQGDVPLVCLHGWGMNLRVFDGLRGQPGSAAVTCFDLPGHGRSPWLPERAGFAAQADWLQAELPPRCTLLGWSLGGQFALELAAREPARFDRLILVSTTPRFAAAPDWPQGMARESLQAFTTAATQDWRQMLADFIWLQLRGSRNGVSAHAQLETALRTHGSPQPETLLAGLSILDSLDLRARLPAIRVPALVISGQHDRVTSPRAGEWLAQALPDARYVELARAGHAPFLSHPDEFNALVAAFREESA